MFSRLRPLAHFLSRETPRDLSAVLEVIFLAGICRPLIRMFRQDRTLLLRSFIGLCFVLITVPRLLAQTDFYSRVWQVENGLPNNIVQTVTQTRDGYLWVGTREGVSRFDGEQFQPLLLSPQTMEPSINSLLAAKDGSLWIGTDGRGVFQFENGELHQRELPGRRNTLTVLRMCEAADESIWLETPRGVFCWKAGKMEHLPDLINLREPQVELGSGKKPICSDDAGRIWMLNGNLVRADLPVPTNYFPKAGLLPSFGRTLYRDNGGAFWIGTDSSASNVLIKVEEHGITRYPRQNGPAGFPQVILRDSAGNLWVGSYEGLSRLVDGRFVTFTPHEEPATATDYRIYALFEDFERNLWVGSDEGLTRLTPKRFKTITKKDGLASNVALAVYASRDGSTWISSWGSGLSHYVDGRVEILNTQNGLPSNFVMALAETRDGSLWTGADYNGQLIRIKDGQVSVFEHKGHHGTPALYEDERGVLWIGNRGNLETWDGKKLRRYTTRNGLSDDEVNAICGGDNGSVWIGTVNGLTRWQNGSFESLAASNALLRVMILSLYHDTSGTLWIGTKGKGLLRWRDGKVDGFNQGCGLYSDSIYAILEDRHTNLWFNSSRGVFRIEKRQFEELAPDKQPALTSINYGLSDGILASGQYLNVTQPAASKDIHGNLWFRTTQGVAVVDPDQAYINRQIPPVTIQQILIDNKPVAVEKLGLDVPRSIRVPPGHEGLEIRYAALSYRAPEKNLYRYKLEGVDADWVNAGNARAVKYNNLEPGDYRFQVMACNNDGVWNTVAQTVEFRFEPYFWQTWWFYSLTALAVLATTGGVARHLTRRRMQQKLHEMEKQRAVEQERARIARDVHDELGAKLTSISFQGSIAKCSANDPEEIQRQIDQMSASAREAVSSLHAIVWAVDPLNDSLDGLIGLLSHRASELFGNSSIRCEIIVPDSPPPVHLSANVRHNLFLAVMEAANNAAKHSAATRVSIQVGLRPEELEILVTDNGTGFAPGVSSGGIGGNGKRRGNGLANMESRMHAIGGKCEIASNAGAGTRIRFIVPLT